MRKTGKRAVIFHLPHPLPGADKVIAHPLPCTVGTTSSLSLARGFEGVPWKLQGLNRMAWGKAGDWRVYMAVGPCLSEGILETIMWPWSRIESGVRSSHSSLRDGRRSMHGREKHKDNSQRVARAWKRNCVVEPGWRVPKQQISAWYTVSCTFMVQHRKLF